MSDDGKGRGPDKPLVRRKITPGQIRAIREQAAKNAPEVRAAKAVALTADTDATDFEVVQKRTNTARKKAKKTLADGATSESHAQLAAATLAATMPDVAGADWVDEFRATKNAERDATRSASPKAAVRIAPLPEKAKNPYVLRGPQSDAEAQAQSTLQELDPVVELLPAADIKQLAKNAARSPDMRLRLEAGLCFMTDPDCSDLRTLQNMPKFQHLSIDKIRHWADQDGWRDKRQRFLQHWATNAYKRIGSQLAQERQKDLSLLVEARTLAMERLRDDDLRARSFEGLLLALVRASEHIQAINAQLIQDMMPPESDTASPLMTANVAAQATLAPEETNAVVSALLASRRDAIRDAQHIDARRADPTALPEDDEPAPALVRDSHDIEFSDEPEELDDAVVVVETPVLEDSFDDLDAALYGITGDD